jgi:CDP-4-dehydro-6-deoxyglucose reductase
MHIVTTTHGHTFDAASGQPLLDAAAASGLVLPYSCRTGRCSTCQCRVVAGATVALHPELGLTDAEKADGWILGCVRSAASDVVLEVEDLGGVALPAPRTLPCRVQSVERLADDVVRIVLRLPPTAAFTFASGQYIDVIGQDGVRRSYSLARAPAASGLLELHVRAVDGGAMSVYWFDRCRANDLLRLNGPLGTFFLRDVAGLDLVFLCTGTGYAPVQAMLETLATLEPVQRPRSATVYWGGRVGADHYHASPAVDGLRTVHVLSRAPAEWAGARGHVQDVFLAERPDLARAVVYACGSDAMIHAARTRLHSEGLPPGRFHSDAFVCSSAAPAQPVTQSS